MPRPLASVGVDLGGTWIRLTGLNPQGKRVKTLRRPAPTHDLPAFLGRELQRWGGRPSSLVVASKGVWAAPERKKMLGHLQGLAKRVQVISDVEAAWLAAFSSEERSHGILILAGTGSIALSRDSKGHMLRSGGLGPFLGDEGSAFWIGQQWLKRNPDALPLDAVLAHVRSHGTPVRDIAALAIKVLKRAQNREKVAMTVILQAQEHLVDLVKNLQKELKLRRELCLSWGGSLLDNLWFRTGFLKCLKRELPSLRIQIVSPKEDPATAAARLGLADVY